MRIRRHSSPSPPGIARRLIASKPWLSILTSTRSKLEVSKANHHQKLRRIYGRERKRSLSPISDFSACHAPDMPVWESSEKDSREERRGRFFSLDTMTSSALPTDWRGIGLGPIRKLPEGVLLEIFDLCRVSSKSHMTYTWPWKRLVHVCRKWRCVVFASPRRLDLRLFCNSKTPVRKTLDIWPALPIIIQSDGRTSFKLKLCNNDDGDNIYAALERRDRVCKIELKNLTSSLLTKITAVMQEPFPALTDLCLSSDDDALPVLPDEFLGGSAPNLQCFELDGIPFPALPNLLSSSTHLVRLRIRRMPQSGHISPVAMATCLAALPSLESLFLEFQSPQSRPSQDNRHPPPSRRVVLPALTIFDFRGVNNYLEDLVAQIDAPQLNCVTSRFFNQLTFDNTQLSRFINRTEMLKSSSRAELEFLSDVAKITLSSPGGRGKLELEISSYQPDWQVSSMARLCDQLSTPISRVQQLVVRKGCMPRFKWPVDMDCTQWLELFNPFVAVEMLGIEKLGQLVVPAFHKLTGESATGVLPSMRTLSFGGLGSLNAPARIKVDLQSFVSARQSSNRPVSVIWGA